MSLLTWDRNILVIILVSVGKLMSDMVPTRKEKKKILKLLRELINYITIVSVSIIITISIIIATIPIAIVMIIQQIVWHAVYIPWKLILPSSTYKKSHCHSEWNEMINSWIALDWSSDINIQTSFSKLERNLFQTTELSSTKMNRLSETFCCPFLIISLWWKLDKQALFALLILCVANHRLQLISNV